MITNRTPTTEIPRCGGVRVTDPVDDNHNHLARGRLELDLPPALKLIAESFAQAHGLMLGEYVVTVLAEHVARRIVERQARRFTFQQSERIDVHRSTRSNPGI